MNASSKILIQERLFAETPDRYCFVKGAAEGKTLLNAFDNALLKAGVGDMNLIRMSSILPVGAQQLTIDDLDLSRGGFLPLAYASIDSTQAGQFIASAMALGVPEDEDKPGVMMEWEQEDRLENVEQKVRQMVKNAFKQRGRPLKEIKSVGIEHKVKKCAATFAGVVLWYD